MIWTIAIEYSLQVPFLLRVDRRSIEKEATALYAAWPNKLLTMFFSSVIIFYCKMCIYNAYNVLHCVYLNIPSYKSFVMKILQKTLNHFPSSIKLNFKITIIFFSISIIIGSRIMDINIVFDFHYSTYNNISAAEIFENLIYKDRIRL